MKIFPYALLRISGGNFEAFKALSLSKSNSSTQEIILLKQEIDLTKIKICNALYQAISKEKDSQLQKNLLNFKRDIFNQRLKGRESFKVISKYLTNKLTSLCFLYFTQIENLHLLRINFDEIYNLEVNEIRACFRVLLDDKQFQNGLILSSNSLVNRLKDYLHDNDLNKKNKKIERSLIKYMSRYYAKTSPFSSFTNLAIIDINTAKNNNTQIFFMDNLRDLRIINNVKLNNQLFITLRELLTFNKRTNKHFKLALNPSLKIENNIASFLVNSHNIEVFQKITLNKEIRSIIKLLNMDSTVNVDILKEFIGTHLFEANNKQKEEYIKQLIDCGLIDYNLGISGIDPDWDLKLINLLKPICKSSQLIRDTVEMLETIRKLAYTFSLTDHSEKQLILTNAYDVFNKTYLRLHKSAGLPEHERVNHRNPLKNVKLQKNKTIKKSNSNQFKRNRKTAIIVKPENFFYEDTIYKYRFSIYEQQIKGIIKLVDKLFLNISIFSPRHEEQYKMSHFFSNQYGINANINLLNFYESYYRDFKKEENTIRINETEKGKIKDRENSIEEIKIIRELKTKWETRFYDNIKKKFVNNLDNINIEHNDFPVIDYDLLKYTPKLYSSGCMIQFFSDRESNFTLRGVLNASCPGHGKMFSRFLYLFDSDLTAQIKKWNHKLGYDIILAEINDAFISNVNLHSLLTPFEIVFPGSQTIGDANTQISFNDVYVRHDNSTRTLYLFHKKFKKRIYTVDNGFLSLDLRSQLFKMLDNFSLSEYSNLLPIWSSIEKAISPTYFNIEESSDKVSIYPRVSYQNILILRRKSWYIPKTLYLQRKVNESNSLFYLRLIHWKEELGLPNEIFVYAFSSDTISNKPQYICFNNPFLVDLFEKIFNTSFKKILIEEMLPNSSQLLKVTDKNYVTEFVTQWYNF